MKVHKEIPIKEICLRKFEKPSGDFDSVLRRFLKSLGLLQLGESRNDILLIFGELLKNRKGLCSKHIVEKTGVSPSNVRRHLRRLREMGLVEKVGGFYRISEGRTLKEIVSEIRGMVQDIFGRVEEYADYLDSILYPQRDL